VTLEPFLYGEELENNVTEREKRTVSTKKGVRGESSWGQSESNCDTEKLNRRGEGKRDSSIH